MTKKGFTRRDLLAYTSAAAAGGALVGAVSPREAFAKDLPKVPRKVLGKTKREIPILLMGAAMKFDQRFDPKFAECLRFGVDYMDMADCYAGGTSETALGNFMQRTKTRDQIWITTKSDDHTAGGIEAVLDKSLEKMKVKHVEMLYMHGISDEGVISKDMAKKAAELKKKGKIKFFGFSTHSKNVVELMNKAAGESWIDSIMFKYNFRQYGNKELNGAIDACAKTNIGLIAMKTQGAEVYPRDAWKKFEKTGKWNKYQAVLKAVWEDERITAAVSHMDTFEKLKQNIAAALDNHKLTQAEKDALDRYASATREFACEGCDHICGAAVDAPVEIGDTMRFLMYHEAYGEQEKAKEMFKKLPAQAQRLSLVDFAPASAVCPHGIDVAQHMQRASELFEA